MLRIWSLRVTPTTTNSSIANNVIHPRGNTSINRPSGFHKPSESISKGAHSKVVKDAPHYTSVPLPGSSGSERGCNDFDENDALHLLAKVEPTLSLIPRNTQVRKLVVDETKTEAPVKTRKRGVNARPPLRYIHAPKQIEAQDALRTHAQDGKSSAKAAEVAHRGLSSLYKFDSERQLLHATATRRPLQFRHSGGTIVETDQHFEKTSFAVSQASEHTDLSGRPQRTPVTAAVRSKAMLQSLKRRRIRQRMGGQFWKFISKRSVVTGPVRLVRARIRVREKTPVLQKPKDAQYNVTAQARRRVTKRRLRSNSIYLLKAIPSLPPSLTKGVESSESLVHGPAALAASKELQSTLSEAGYDDTDLADAIDELTSAPQRPPVIVARRASGRSHRQD